MKLIKITAMAFLGIFMLSCGEEEAPANIEQAFIAEYPYAEDVEWDKEDNGWEVEFEMNELDGEILYSMDGTVLETDIEVDGEDVPLAITEYLKNNYPTFEMEEVDMETSERGVFYEVEIEGAEGELEIIFDEMGNFLEAKAEGEQK